MENPNSKRLIFLCVNSDIFSISTLCRWQQSKMSTWTNAWMHRHGIGFAKTRYLMRNECVVQLPKLLDLLFVWTKENYQSEVKTEKMETVGWLMSTSQIDRSKLFFYEEDAFRIFQTVILPSNWDTALMPDAPHSIWHTAPFVSQDELWLYRFLRKTICYPFSSSPSERAHLGADWFTP